ncbi:MAG: AAC(3) family N-acetyltransferase [Sedimentisphaerales bacterium]
MTVAELIRLSLAARCPLPVYLQMYHGLWRIAKRTLFPPRISSKNRPVVSAQKLTETFERMGLAKNDSVFVHSGIGNIGIIEGGCRTVYNLLTEYVDTDKGNLLFPTFSFYYGVYDYLESNPVFDVRTAPTYMGTLTQYALKLKKGTRSICPTHSVLVIGKDSEILTADHHRDPTPFGPNSPFQKFLRLDNPKILLIGVTSDAITFVHVVEDSMAENFPIKTYTDKGYVINCIDHNAQPLSVKTRCHTPVVSLSRDITRFDRLFREEGVICREAPVGLSSIAILDPLKFVNLLTELAYEGKTIYGNIHF